MSSPARVSHMIWYVVIAICCVLLAAVPFLVESQRDAITPRTRKRADGRFAALSQGQTHYRWAGGARGPVIVMVHGLTTPSIVWNGITPALTALGFRVLSYDLYGRGFSDAPRGAQNLAFFTQQLDDLLVAQGVTENITLMGYSMGGSIVTAYAAANLDRVARVILVAPAGIETQESLFDRFCRVTPIAGDWAHGMFAARRARRGSTKPKTIEDMQEFQLARRGYLPSILASRRGALSETLEDAHRILGRNDVPVWAVWGRDDVVILLSAVGVLSKWNRDVYHDDIAGAGHGLPYTHPDELAGAITKMLRDR